MKEKKISKNNSVKYWLYLKSQILNDFDNPNLWENACNLFEERIDFRYLMPIKKIEEDKLYVGEGFAVMTLYCSLIEFLESTMQGINYVDKNPRADNFEYSNGKSKEIFVSFLTNRFGFKIDSKIADQFYKKVRCSLLHEAKLSANWLIRVDGAKIIDEKNGMLIINRLIFSKRIEKYISNYKKRLKNEYNMKQAFIRKFDYLCS